MPLNHSSLQALVSALNKEQREAVLHRGSPLLVLAGAGTGKTRVITVRMAHLVAHDKLPPEHILALTFTNKAAGEMRERMASFLGRELAAQMTIGTFHSLGLQILERDHKKLGYQRGLSLLDPSDQETAVRECLHSLNMDPRRHDPRLFLTKISNARNLGLPPSHFHDNPDTRTFSRIYAAYLSWLKAYQSLDFDDLILKTNQLFQEQPKVLERWRQRFQSIVVDEYQDTNLAQLQLVRALAEERRELCVVGDDDQSIYGWRGADVRNILEFERHFPDAKAMALTQNYRSTGHILDAANAVIGHNTARREKSLWSADGEGHRLSLVRCKDSRVEAQYIAAEILRIKAHEGRPFRDFGVLFRSSAQTRALEEAMRLAGVPFRMVGASSFFERKEIKDILSYLKLAIRPSDDLSLLRVINFPNRKLGPVTIEKLRRSPLAIERGLFFALANLQDIEGLKQGQRTAITAFHGLISELNQAYEAGLKLRELLDLLIERLGGREIWIRDLTSGPGGQKRWKNIQSLKSLMAHWEERNPSGRVEDWLRAVALDSRTSEDGEEEDAVTMLTLHASKGLEWPVCFLVGCQQGILPHQRVIEDMRGDISEERRLFYVGITRAQKRCYISHAKVKITINGRERQKPSVFLGEIPELHYLSIDRSEEGELEEDTKKAKAAQNSRFSQILQQLKDS